MINKLELRHLAPYLPYRISVVTIHKRDTGKSFELLALHTNKNTNYSSVSLNINPNFRTRLMINSIRPILRPLSDLTKVATKEGGIEMNTLEIIFGSLYRGSLNGGQSTGQIYPWDRNPILWKWYQTQKLFEFHFDVFGLIEKGLAVNINTI